MTIDTLRADHLECYGYDQIKTPNINRLAREGVRFSNFNTPAPLTLPSHCSIFTGTYPLYHGVRDNGGFYLDSKHITLAELLKENGFRTGAFIGAFVLDSRWGLGQGFVYYFDNFDLTKYKKISLDAVQRRGNEVFREAQRWIESSGFISMIPIHLMILLSLLRAFTKEECLVYMMAKLLMLTNLLANSWNSCNR